MAAATNLTPAAAGRLAGLDNLFQKEMRDWWGTRRWWTTALVWLAILNGILALILFAAPDPEVADAAQPTAGAAVPARDEMAVQVFFQLAGYALSIGVVVLAQDELIGERRSGTAAWILSKPVSRSAFILAKLLGNLPGILGLMVLLQAGVAYGLIALQRGSPLPAGPFLAGLGPLILNLFFYLTLTLMLGALANSRGAVIGIPLVLILLPDLFLMLAPWLNAIMPWPLPDMAAALALQKPLPAGSALAPVLATAAWSVIFMVVAVWRFQREEL